MATDGAGENANVDIGLQADLMACDEGDGLKINTSKFHDGAPVVKGDKNYTNINFYGKVAGKLEKRAV